MARSCTIFEFGNRASCTSEHRQMTPTVCAVQGYQRSRKTVTQIIFDFFFIFRAITAILSQVTSRCMSKNNIFWWPNRDGPVYAPSSTYPDIVFAEKGSLLHPYYDRLETVLTALTGIANSLKTCQERASMKRTHESSTELERVPVLIEELWWDGRYRNDLKRKKLSERNMKPHRGVLYRPACFPRGAR